WNAATARRRHQCAGLRRRYRLAISCGLATGFERQRVRPDAWYTTWAILYEFLRVTTRPRVIRNRGAHRRLGTSFLRLLASPGFALLVPTQRHTDIAGEVIRELPHLSGNLLHDAHTAILMREHESGA